MNASKSVSPAQRVAASRARDLDAGGRRIDLRLPAGSDALAALDTLLSSDYADSATSCIARALIEASKR